MPDDQQKTEIPIVTTYDGKGAKEAAVDLNALDDATKKTGKATDAASDSMEDAAGTSEKLGGMHRELHAALLQITEQSPIAGAALSISFLGAVGAILTAVELFRAAKGAIKEYETELDNAADAATQPLDGGIKAVQDAWDTATVRMGAYYAALETAGTEDKDPIAKQIEFTKKLDEARYQGIEKIIKALGQQEEAQIRANDAGDPEKMKQDLAAAAGATQSSLDQLNDWRDSRGQADLQTEQAMRQKAQPGLESAVNSANAALESADAALDKNKTVIKNLTTATAPLTEQQLAELRKKNMNDPRVMADDAQKTMDDLLSSHQVVMQKNRQTGKDEPMGFTPDALKQFNDAQAKLAEANKELENQRTLLQQDKTKETQLQEDRDAAQTRYRTASDQAVQNKNRLGELPTEISQAGQISAVQTGDNKLAGTIEGITTAIKTGAAPSQATLAALVAAVEDTKATSAEHAAAVAALSDALKYLGSGAKDINTIVKGLMTHAINNAQEIASIKSRFQDMDNRISRATYNANTAP